MALTPRLELRQSQTLVMTPQLQKAIKLLQYSNIELRAVSNMMNKKEKVKQTIKTKTTMLCLSVVIFLIQIINGHKVHPMTNILMELKEYMRIA